MRSGGVMQVQHGQDLPGDLGIGLPGQRHAVAGGGHPEQRLDGGDEGGGAHAGGVHERAVDVPEDDPLHGRHRREPSAAPAVNRLLPA